MRLWYANFRESKGKVVMRKLILLVLVLCTALARAQHKAVFIVVDGIPADVIEKVETPFLDEIARSGGYTRAYIGGEKGGYSQSPTISAVGYNHLLTGTWTNKHNVWDNDIKDPNYQYWTIFRMAKQANPALKTGIFSTWLDNRTRLIGTGLPQTGNLQLDYVFDGYEHDTVRFPHDPDKKYILAIDERVADEAAATIRTNAPDLSWVYLEYTDDMGHRYGDSPQFYDAVKLADAQIGRIWKAIQHREATTKEKWMIVITTDHGREAATGKGHGGQSDRERSVWMTTNYQPLNARFQRQPATVDIMPSLLRFMHIDIPPGQLQELDGVPFVGPVSIANLKAVPQGNQLVLTWDVLDPAGMVEIFVSTTNHFKTGGIDAYQLLAKTKAADGRLVLDVSKLPSSFYKIRAKAPHNEANTWVLK